MNNDYIDSPLNSFSLLLTILFAGFKLNGVIDWSWFWVISPLLIVFHLILIIDILLWGVKLFHVNPQMSFPYPPPPPPPPPRQSSTTNCNGCGAPKHGSRCEYCQG